jgi:hypothetical protein
MAWATICLCLYQAQALTNYGAGAITNNAAFGDAALDAILRGIILHLGSLALTDNTQGTGNTAVGRQALQSNTIGANNSSVGRTTLLANISGSNNCAFGLEALRNTHRVVLILP